MTISDLSVLVGTAIAAAVAIIGVQIRLVSVLSDRIRKLENAVDSLGEWYDRWRNIPDDLSSAPLLDRRLVAIEHRLDQIEQHLERPAT